MAATETVEAPRVARRGWGLLDVLLATGIAALLAFPVLATIAADRLPLDAPAALPPLPAHAKPAALRDLPVGQQPGGDLRTAATALLGERRAARLLTLVRTGTTGNPVPGVYPYRYPTLEPLLPATLPVDAATDLGARLIRLETNPTGRLWAAPAAYALLDRARRAGACEPSLNVLLLVASDSQPRDRIIAEEGELARRACPGDPTPGWLLGQYQSTMALPDIRLGESLDPAVGLATFVQLVRDVPGAAAAWAGQADALVRLAATTPPEQPWVARHRYERALARYRRAARLSPGGETDMGVAWALAGLGRADEAVAIQRRAVAALPPVPLPQAQLVVYLESAHRFGEAAAAAERLIELGGNEPPGPGLFPDLPTGPSYTREDVYGLMSLGAGRLAPLSVALDPQPPPPAANASIGDLSFIPQFRDGPLTGSDRWCAEWARRRDLILAGRPAEAMARFPRSLEPLPGHDDQVCSEVGFLTAIAKLELGDRRVVVPPDVALNGWTATAIADEHQNVWRWAGDLTRAERAARGWIRSAPRASLPLLRLGEIEFLDGRFDDAARDFGAAARRARERAEPDALAEARAMLDRGAALVAAGRREEGEAALRAADDVASRAGATTLSANFGVTDAELTALSYYARVQLGEAAREAGALPAAADAYAAARERVPELKDLGEPVHVEQLENNSAIVDVGLGRFRSAQAASARALEVDPENPALLMTAGFAAERAGNQAEAIRLNRAALAADATTYPAANDLGVLLARAGRDDEAVTALRRAVGAEPRYALGWFNLGVVLAGMGPARLLGSQGALARAFSLDPDLRDREREPTIDARTYRTGLDVSRPLPPEWSFAASQRQAPAKTVGLVALLLAAFTLSRTLGSRGSGRSLAETWLAPLDRAAGRLGFLRRLAHPAIAIAATLVVFVAPLARDPSGGATAAAAGVLGLCLLLAVALRGRGLAARREPESERQRTWAPGLLFGLGGAAAGVTWAPLPVLGAKASPRLHWAAPAALAVVAVPLVLATAWSDVPLARSLAAAALIMAASLLTPVKPVDGGAIAAAGGTAAGLTAIALAALLALGLV
jgi:cellulose synthase operon protein C